LQQICVSFGLKKIGNIADLRKRIINHSTIDLSEKEKIAKKFDSFDSPNKENPTKIYRENFNMVDRLDKYWNESDYHLKMEHWKTKFMWSIMKQILLNAFAFYNEYLKCDWLGFRKLAAEVMISWKKN